jgi:hypothetical protein
MYNPDTDICLEKHKRIDEKLNIHEKRLDKHSDRLDKLEQYQSRTEAIIKNLCEKIDSLVTTMRWFIGLLVGAFVTFFFYVVQRGVFK